MMFVVLLIVTGPEVKMVNPNLMRTENVGSIDVCVQLTGSGYLLDSNLIVTLTDIGTPNSMCM